MLHSTAPEAPAADFRALRDREFPHLARAPWLNAASMGPLPERARLAVEAYNRRRSDIHSLRGEDFEPLMARARRAAARLIGADADEIALLPNTSHGLNLAALSLPLEPGRRVLVSDREFPANVYPWLALRETRGARVDVVPADARGNPDEARLLEELARGDVGILAISAVQFTSGWVADLEALGRACRANGAFLVVDAIQAVGQRPVDVRASHVDVLATGCHKWMCSPFGTGFTYVRRELVERMEPRVIGWSALTASADLERVLDYAPGWVEGARRFEVATQPWQDYAGMVESAELLLEAGPARIRAHVLALQDPLAGWVEARGMEIVSDRRPERRSGIFAFTAPDAAGAFRALKGAGVGCVLREGAVRLSPHLYNQPEDIGRVMDVLDGVDAVRGAGDEVRAMVEAVRDELAPDPRLAVFDVEVVIEGGRLTLSGATSEPAAAQELHRRVASLTAWDEVVDAVQLLPEADADDRVHAVVSAAVAPMLGGPRIQSTQVSQAVLGSRLIVFRREGRWLQCRGADGYIGWIHAGYVALMDEGMARAWELGADGDLWVSLDASVVQDSGDVLVRLPWAARVLREQDGIVRLPDGRTGHAKGEMLPLGARGLGFPGDASAICETASRWLGVPYLWGGITMGGVDCSGFVQALYRMHGFVIPRDSDQQSRAGQPVECGDDFEHLQPGDLLFFAESEGRCSHVAMSTGGSQIVHSSLGNGGVARNDMTGRRNYEKELRRMFLWARRMV